MRWSARICSRSSATCSPTDTADLADVILPAASWLECDDIVVPYFHHALAAQVKTAEPLGESQSNSEIFRRIATAMGLTDDVLLERDEPIIERVVLDAGLGGVSSFAELAPRAGRCGRPRTARGRAIRRSALPDAERPDRTRREHGGRGRRARRCCRSRRWTRVPRGGRLRLLSPASPWSINASFSNDAKVARQAGALTLSLTATDAAERGLEDGAMAVVRSTAGELIAPVRITNTLPAGVAVIPKGGWPKLTAPAAPASDMLTDLGSRPIWAPARRFMALR